MSHTRLLIAAAIIALAIIIGFVLSVPHTSEVPRTDLPETLIPVPAVTLHDSFKKGVHTITGSLMAPNACTTVVASATVIGSASSTHQSILVSISMPEDTSVCLQLPTRASFSTTIKADAGLPIQATVNGFVATTTSS